MKTVRLIVPVTALLIFTFGWDPQTNVFAEQSRPLTAAEKKTKACEHANVECVNGCRNGTHLPIGSSSDAIRTCDVNCGNAFNRCNAAMVGGTSTGAFSGTNRPILRRGIEAEGADKATPDITTPPAPAMPIPGGK